MGQTMSNFSGLLKEFFTPDRIAVMILESSPFLAMVGKKEIAGSDLKVPVLYGDSPGHSATFSTAQANKGASTSNNFAITTATHYALANISRQVMLASRVNIGAFLPAARVNIEGAFRQLRRDLAIHLYRDGTGARGQTSSYGGGAITLTNAMDAVNFQIGDVIVNNATKTATSFTGYFTITAIDTIAGTLTVTATGGATTTANDWLFVQGDPQAVTTGLASWITQPSAPTSASFFGVDRSVNGTMLGGVRSSGAGKLRYEAIIDLQSDIMAVGDGMPTHGFCHPNDFRALVKELEAQVVRPKPVDIEIPVRRDSNALVGFSGISIQGNTGVIEVYPDRFCPQNLFYALQMDDWGLAHIGPEVADLVGREEDEGMLVEAASDGFEVRVASYPQLYTRAPGHSGVCYSFGQ